MGGYTNTEGSWLTFCTLGLRSLATFAILGMQKQLLASQTGAGGCAGGTLQLMGQVQFCALSRLLWALHRAAVCFNWRAGLPLKRRQPMRVGAHWGPANQSKRLLPSLRVASARRLRRQLSSPLTSVQPAALPPRAHICPLGGRNPFPRPSPLKGKEQREGQMRSRQIHSGQKREQIEKSQGIFRELAPKINAEQCSLPTVFLLVLGVHEARGQQKPGPTLSWARSLVT